MTRWLNPFDFLFNLAVVTLKPFKPTAQHRLIGIELGSLPRPKSAFILASAIVFFLFLLNIFLNSFSADYRIFLRDTASYYNTGSLMPLFHLAGELTGEVGVILRFAGACILLIFAAILVRKSTFSWTLLAKAVLFEGIYYLFNIVFIAYLLVRGNAITYYGAAASYLLQLLFVTPVFIVLYFKLKSSNRDIKEVAKWVAFAIIGFVFALWAKHFLLAIYALPMDFSIPTFAFGFVNSVFTLLIAGLIMIVVLAPVYKKKTILFNSNGFGGALILAGFYAIIFLVISLFNMEYMRWISLIDWWTIVFVVLGIGFLIIRKGNGHDGKQITY